MAAFYCWINLAVILAAIGLDTTRAGEVVIALPIRNTESVGGYVNVTLSPLSLESHPEAIFLTAGIDPIAVLTRSEGADYGIARASLDPGVEDRLEAWAYTGEHAAELLSKWPVEGAFRAEITTVGLGGATVWLDAGNRDGITAGDHWWLRVAGQPVARFDVLFAGDDDCYCRVCPLVAGWSPRVGERAGLWPSPGMKRTGRAASAVVFVQATPDSREIWLAALPGADVGDEPRIDFYRGGQFLATGSVDRKDKRFWYVRLTSDSKTSELQIGDDAVIRTAADMKAKRFVGRVFDLTTGGGLIDVGEIDGLRVGDSAPVYREGKPIGAVEIVRTQRTYSTVRLKAVHAVTKDLPTGQGGDYALSTDTERSSGNGLPVLGDIVRFDTRNSRSRHIGTIERVCDRMLLSVRLNGEAPPLLKPLLIQREARTIGVAITIKCEGDRALMLAIPESAIDDPRRGDFIATSAFEE